MNIVYCDDYDVLSERAAALVVSQLHGERNTVLCAASGRSPLGLYRELARKVEQEPTLFERVTLVELDEWAGLADGDPASCKHYVDTHLMGPLGIGPDRYLGFSSQAADPSRECDRVRAALARYGSIDLCILGVGVNGHIGFNEPGPFLIPHCHLSCLTKETRLHAMVRSKGSKPEFGYTLGMQEILAAKRILLLIAGDGKENVIADLVSAKVSTSLPASLLWLHPDVDCLIDRGATGAGGDR
jgi:putative deaminase/isomerase